MPRGGLIGKCRPTVIEYTLVQLVQHWRIFVGIVLLFCEQVFKTSAFPVHDAVVTEFFRAREVRLEDVTTSPRKRRLSVTGIVDKVGVHQKYIFHLR